MSYIPKKKRSITIDHNLEEKLRKIQGQLIDKTGETWSLSTIINLSVASGLLCIEKLTREDFQQIEAVIKGKKISLDNNTIKIFVEKISKFRT